MTKPETTQSAATGTKPIDPITKTQYQTINISASFKGEDIREVSIEFVRWAREMEDKFDCRLLHATDSFNNYWPVDRTRTSD